WEGWVISLRQKQKKLIMLPSETMIWQPEFTDKTLSRKTGAVHTDLFAYCMAITITTFRKPFTFKAAKDFFHRRIIQTIPSATHTLHYPITPE
ncbi:hypothetical protein, partial [Escherichia coli]